MKQRHNPDKTRIFDRGQQWDSGLTGFTATQILLYRSGSGFIRWLIAGLMVLSLVLVPGELWGTDVKYNKLTPEEERVIVHKGTERPFSGEFNSHFEQGTYICKRCNAPLYRSDDKFESSCGWPSFDDEIPGSIERTPDADGLRTEITCKRCDAHLGHVFIGEELTSKNTRHCVNSLSLDFLAYRPAVKTETAYFAAGCFWGAEHLFKDREGILSTRVGYMGGHTDRPTYQDICSGQTGHAEALEVVFDPAKTSFEVLARFFFEIHDPGQVNRQGPDIGDQYRSAIFYTSEAQKQTSQKLIQLLKTANFRVATTLEKAAAFWEAEDYHQDYYIKTGKQPYCHFYSPKFD
jgi:peptide methionine sulfoxide reductase msrA/msrB